MINQKDLTYSEFNLSLEYKTIQQQLYWSDSTISLNTR